MNRFEEPHVVESAQSAAISDFRTHDQEEPKLALLKRAIEKTVISLSEKRPAVNQRVILVCKEFRCLGYADRHGAWRDAKGNELQEVLGWFEV